MSMRSFRRVQLSLGVMALVLAGCSASGSLPRSRGVDPFVPTNVTGEAVIPADVRRVVLLPLYGGEVAPGEMTVELDRAFATALQEQGRFEVIALTREECLRRFRAESLSAANALPRELFTVLRDGWGADAVMFVDLTAFEPNRPLVLGVRAKLARLDDARLVWALDTVYSAADPAVAEGARRHAMAGRRTSTPVNLDAGILQSPSRFAAYVATTSFATLPPR